MQEGLKGDRGDSTQSEADLEEMLSNFNGSRKSNAITRSSWGHCRV